MYSFFFFSFKFYFTNLSLLIGTNLYVFRETFLRYLRFTILLSFRSILLHLYFYITCTRDILYLYYIYYNVTIARYLTRVTRTTLGRGAHLERIGTRSLRYKLDICSLRVVKRCRDDGNALRVWYGYRRNP